MNELRRFIEVEQPRGGEEWRSGEELGGNQCGRPKFNKIYQNSAVRELTLREGEERTLRSFINAAHVGASRWGPRLVDEDRHATGQAIHNGVEGASKFLPTKPWRVLLQLPDYSHP